MYYTILETHMCPIILVGDEQGLRHLHLETGEGKRTFEISKDWVENALHFEDVITELKAYMRGEQVAFSAKLNPLGTEFQKSVWHELKKIPPDELRTYKDIAQALGNPNGARAVGMANGKNPIPIIIPCHRVVGSNGKLTGFAHGLAIKEKLIGLEKMGHIYRVLKAFYGDIEWWPADNDYEMMVGAILTQNTNWTNVEKALHNLGDRLKPEIIVEMDLDELAAYIRPSGYYNQKAKKIKAFTKWFQRYNFKVSNTFGVEIEELRQELLAIKGVGGETADCILTYSLMKPSFIIDTYTRRLFQRIGVNVPKDYDDVKALFEDVLEKDLKVYGQYHGLIVEHSKKYCNKTPKCTGCPLIGLCERQII